MHEFQRDPFWYKDAIIYQVHVKSFFDSNEDGYGDFPGLIQKLDYIQDLGVDCIWLLPFYPSPLKDDGYDIADYETVNPTYGTTADFQRFVEEAHKRGIKVLTELVVNHTSDQHVWFQAARLAPPGSPEREFYVWSNTAEKYKDARIIFLDYEDSNWSWDPVAQAYYWHRFFHHQPDLNFDNPEVMEAIIKVMKYWLDMGVDGMRLDAIPYLVERESTNCENLPETHDKLKQLRKVLDDDYPARIFLAEANQWPEDVREYFGNGDECHMAYHFPVMPRIYMAAHMEDKTPIVEILARTPDIPPACQWAMFLRNHDELTLEMVTEEERDYMYKAYAADPRMRINLGIRRRLAPLLEFNRGKIELLNSLLFSLPGTPILYYGDEIGMGDNIHLEDRHGVRTPMQWSADRNGGFSRAPVDKLYGPPINDPSYGFQSVNVESQEQDPSSLLNWMRSLIKLRRKYKAFGRGSLRMLENDNSKVLSFLREHEGETILVVANLSRYAQVVHLNLPEFDKVAPIEMFGLGAFHQIDAHQPYVLSLAPHSFYWLLLSAPESELPLAVARAGELKKPELNQASPEPIKLAHLELDPARPYEDLFHDADKCALFERAALPEYLRNQRWYAGKNKVLKNCTVTDWVELQHGAFVFVEVDYEDDASEVYSVFMRIGSDAEFASIQQEQPTAVIAEFRGGGIYDALQNDESCLELMDLMSGETSVEGLRGWLRASKTMEFSPEAGAPGSSGGREFELANPQPSVRRITAEQSNSSVVIDEKYILKIYRKLLAGANSDYAIGCYLREHNFKHTPAVLGAFEYTNERNNEPYMVGIVQELVRNQGDEWTHTVEEFRRFYERAGTHSPQLLSKVLPKQGLSSLVDKPIPQEVLDLLGMYLQEAGLMGRRTAEMHLALASDQDRMDFRPEPISQQEWEQYVEKVAKGIETVATELSSKIDELSRPTRAVAQDVLMMAPAVVSKIKAVSGAQPDMPKMRCHGDLHLGQVLNSFGDVCIFDFEGEPARSVEERNEKQAALKDIAGMLRSFSYAAYAGVFLVAHNRPADLQRLMPWARVCHLWSSVAFLQGYFKEMSQTKHVTRTAPADKEQFFRMLTPFLIEKVFYEVSYELNNRPDWLEVPLSSMIEYLKFDLFP